MFCFFKKITKVFFTLFTKKKKAKSIVKSVKIAKKSQELLSKLNVFKKDEPEQKNDFLTELSMFILKEFGVLKYFNFALYFAKLLK